MTNFPILAIHFVLNLIAVLFVICCIVLILIILIQKGKGGGLSSAFGGGMTGGILGTKTGDFLTWVTIVLVSIMLIFAVILAKYYKEVPTGAPVAAPAAAGTTSTQQAPVTPSQESTSGTDLLGQTNDESDSTGSPVTMMEETDIVESEVSAEETTNTGENTNETGDANQAGN